MDKEKFEKKKSRILKNGLSTIKGLENIFKKLLECEWYETWEYPDEYRKMDGSKLEPVDCKFLISRIRILVSELDKFSVKIEKLWEKGGILIFKTALT